MHKSKQNKVPAIFKDIYNPILAMKKLLISNKNGFNDDESRTIVRGLMISHFGTFLINSINHVVKSDPPTKILIARAMIEKILERATNDIPKDYISKISSLADQLAKYLNTTPRYILDVAMYNAYLNFEIYYHIHSELELFEFKSFITFDKETLHGMKVSHDYHVKI